MKNWTRNIPRILLCLAFWFLSFISSTEMLFTTELGFGQMSLFAYLVATGSLLLRVAILFLVLHKRPPNALRYYVTPMVSVFFFSFVSACQGSPAAAVELAGSFLLLLVAVIAFPVKNRKDAEEQQAQPDPCPTCGAGLSVGNAFCLTRGERM